MKTYEKELSALDRAVIAQMGGECWNIGGGRCEIDDDTAEELANVCRGGASAGFTGFIYYTDTRDFFIKNRAEIIARLREQIAEGLFTDESGAAVGVVGAVCMFACLRDEDRDEIEEQAARALFGPVADIESGELDTVANACAWGALEDLAFSLDGAEADEDGEEIAE